MDNEAFRLIMLEGPQPDKVFTLAKEIIAIGRDTLNDVVINDPEVSRQHARMRYENGVYIIEDLGSTNGTFVNGARITGPYTLADGDEVGLGETISLVFKASVAAATETIVAPSSDDFAPPPPAVPESEPPFDASLPAAEPPDTSPFDAGLPAEAEPSTPPPPFPDDSVLDEPIAPPPPFDAGPPMDTEPEVPPMPFDAGLPEEAEPATPPPPFDAGFAEAESAPPPQPFQEEPAFSPPPPPSPSPMEQPVRPPTTATPVGPPSAVPAQEKPKSRRNLLIGCGCLVLLVICAIVLGFGYLLWNAPNSFFDDPIGNFGDLFGSIILPLFYLL